MKSTQIWSSRSSALVSVDYELWKQLGEPANYEEYIAAKIDYVDRGIATLKAASILIDDKFKEAEKSLANLKAEMAQFQAEVEAVKKPYAIIPQVEMTDECWVVGGDECPFAYWEIDEQSYVGCRHKSNNYEQVFELKRPVDEYATPNGQDAIEAEVRSVFKHHISHNCPYRIDKSKR